MFMMIDNKDMGIAAVDAWIKSTRNNNKDVISPDFAKEVLSKTNHRGHIKTVIKNIKDRCKTAEDLAPYKEFILSCVDERKMSDHALRDLREMAKICGCEEEFDEVNNKPKFYNETDCGGVTVTSNEDLARAVVDDGVLKIYFYSDEAELRWMNLSSLEIRFKDNAKVDLESAELPKNLDVSMCSEVNLSGCKIDVIENLRYREGAKVDLSLVKDLYRNLDLSMCDEIKFDQCYLDRMAYFNLKDGVKISLQSMSWLPEDLDLSMFSKIDLSYSNISQIRNFNFREGSEVILSCVRDMPKELDLSMCDKVDLSHNNLDNFQYIKFKDGVELCVSESFNTHNDYSMCSKLDMTHCGLWRMNEMKFRDGSEIILNRAGSCPMELDLSFFSKVDMIAMDLENVSEIKFRKGAKINMKEAKNVPEKIDFSMCDEVCLDKVDLSNVKVLSFKDEEQCKKAMSSNDSFNGMITFGGEGVHEEEKSRPVNSRRRGAEWDL